MARINKLPPRPKRNPEAVKTDKQKMRAEAYATPQWKKMRETYLKEHPLCEECLKIGKVTPATQVHHKISPFKGEEINWGLLYDYKNLEAVDAVCHQRIHNAKRQITPEEIIAQLDALFDENLKDEEIEKDGGVR